MVWYWKQEGIYTRAEEHAVISESWINTQALLCILRQPLNRLFPYSKIDLIMPIYGLRVTWDNICKELSRVCGIQQVLNNGHNFCHCYWHSDCHQLQLEERAETRCGLPHVPSSWILFLRAEMARLLSTKPRLETHASNISTKAVGTLRILPIIFWNWFCLEATTGTAIWDSKYVLGCNSSALPLWWWP